MRKTCILLACLAVCFIVPASYGLATPVIGTFDSTRGGDASVSDGALTTELRGSLLANFAGTTFVTTPTLTDEFFSNIEMMLLTNATGESSYTTLTAAEQLALGDFVRNGGAAMLFADPYFGLSAQDIVEPFAVTLFQDLNGGPDLLEFPDPLAHPVSNGPFGVVTTALAYYYGWFSDLGPYAVTLATNPINGQPSIVVVPENAMSPGSGRVLIFADATLFADTVEGFFSENQTLFLNSISYLMIPEPSTTLLLGPGFVVLCLWRLRTAGHRSSRVCQERRADGWRLGPGRIAGRSTG